ncbi:MAG: hypothetical protein AAGJ87_16185, partial [Pseudomonadota bacterium]
MLQFSRWQTILIVGSVLLGALFAAPNFFSDDQLESLPGFFPRSQVNLGLDLQGGSYLLVGVDTEKVVETRLATARRDIQRAMIADRSSNRDRIVLRSLPTINQDTGVITLRVQDEARSQDALRRVRDVTRAGLGGVAGLGLQSYEVTRNGDTIQAALTPEARRYFESDAVNTSIAVIRRRIDPAGNKEVSIQPQGGRRIVIQVPGDDDPERLKEVIAGKGQLSFHQHDATVNPQDAEDGLLPPRRILVPFAASEGPGSLVLYEDPIITGDNVNS